MGGAQRPPLVVPDHRHQFATLVNMAPTASKRTAAGKQQTRLSFKNVRKNASASLKPSKPSLVTAAASKATTKLNESRKRATRASDVSSIEPDEQEVEEVSEPEGTEPSLSFESVRYTPLPSHIRPG